MVVFEREKLVAIAEADKVTVGSVTGQIFHVTKVSITVFSKNGILIFPSPFDAGVPIPRIDEFVNRERSA
jgi:hypothetical protein